MKRGIIFVIIFSCLLLSLTGCVGESTKLSQSTASTSSQSSESSNVDSSSTESTLSSAVSSNNSSQVSSKKVVPTQSKKATAQFSSQGQPTSSSVPGKGKIVKYSLDGSSGFLLYENGDVYYVDGIKDVTDTTCKYNIYQKVFSNAKDIYFDYTIKCVINKNNDLYVWGKWSYRSSEYNPTEAPQLLMQNVRSVTGRFIITNTNELYIYGDYNDSNKNDERLKVHTPKKIMDNISSVSGNGNHKYALKTSGDLIMFDYEYIVSYLLNSYDYIVNTVVYSNVKSFKCYSGNFSFLTNSNDLYGSGEFYNSETDKRYELNLQKIASNVQSYSCSNFLSYITSDNKLFCYNQQSLFVDDNVRYVFSVGSSMRYIKNDNKLYTWGYAPAGYPSKKVTFVRDNCLIVSYRAEIYVELSTLGDLYIYEYGATHGTSLRVIFD